VEQVAPLVAAVPPELVLCMHGKRELTLVPRGASDEAVCLMGRTVCCHSVREKKIACVAAPGGVCLRIRPAL
jgi:hypothetical protein